MKILKEKFGVVEGQEVDLYTLTNDNGMEVKVSTYGATITSVSIPGKNNERVSLVCGFDTLEAYFGEAYLANSPYFGCTVGRYSSQIKDAKFSIEDKEYELAPNCGPNNLHGGVKGFDKQVWSAEEVTTEVGVGVKLARVSPDGEEGYPGTVEVSVEMILNKVNEITINYKASTDKVTPLSLTNHSYWNLSGFKNDVLNYEVAVNTDKLLELDETGAATGVKSVTGTKEDLMTGQVIKEVHEAKGDGFENFYVFEDTVKYPIKIAQVESKEDNRKLEVFSNEPCMLFYTAKYMSDELQRNANEKYGKYRAFACETHRWPNGPNLEDAPGSLTAPEIPFESTTVFKITW